MWAQIYIFEKEWQFSGRRIIRLTAMCCVVCKFNEEGRDQSVAIQLEDNWTETSEKHPRSFCLERHLLWTKKTHHELRSLDQIRDFSWLKCSTFICFWTYDDFFNDFFCFHCFHFRLSYCVSKLLSSERVFSMFSDLCSLLCVWRMRCHWEYY